MDTFSPVITNETFKINKGQLNCKSNLLNLFILQNTKHIEIRI